MAKNCRGRHSGFAVLVALAALALAGCGSRNTYVAPPPPKVVVAQALQHAATFYVYLTGNTAAFRTANLVARVQGYLESIDYTKGAAVTKSTQLIGIERDTNQSPIDLAKAQLAKICAPEAGRGCGDRRSGNGRSAAQITANLHDVIRFYSGRGLLC